MQSLFVSFIGRALDDDDINDGDGDDCNDDDDNNDSKVDSGDTDSDDDDDDNVLHIPVFTIDYVSSNISSLPYKADGYFPPEHHTVFFPAYISFSPRTHA